MNDKNDTNLKRGINLRELKQTPMDPTTKIVCFSFTGQRFLIQSTTPLIYSTEVIQLW